MKRSGFRYDLKPLEHHFNGVLLFVFFVDVNDQ